MANDKNAVSFSRKHIFELSILFFIVLSVVMRIIFLPVRSADMNMFLLEWYDEIVAKGGGIGALVGHSANYNMAYMYLMLLATKLPFSPVESIKFFSILFDYILCAGVAFVVYELTAQNRKKALIALVITSLLPLSVLNSSFWGQCDSIYVSFIVFALYYCIKDKWTLSFLLLSIAFCFKLQAIFVLPFFILLFVSKKSFSALNFLIIPGTLFAMSLPVILAGAPITTALDVYMGQVDTYKSVYINYFNLSTFFAGSEYAIMGKFLFIQAVAIFFAMFALVIYKKPIFSADNMVLLMGWSVMTCVVVFPSMHERYAFAGEILLLIWLFVKPSLKRMFPAIITYVIGFAGYSQFLFGAPWEEASLAIALVCVANYAYITFILVQEIRLRKQSA